jgi:hypothetical protein
MYTRHKPIGHLSPFFIIFDKCGQQKYVLDCTEPVFLDGFMGEKSIPGIELELSMGSNRQVP